MEERIGGAKRRALQRGVSRALSKTKRRQFLEYLAATCNVSASAKAAGASITPFYNLRRRDADFAAAWREAMEAGYERLEEALLAKALADVAPTAFDAGAVETVLIDTGAADAGPVASEAAATRQPARGGMRAAAGIGAKVALVEVQLALALLNRRQAADRAGRERHGRRRATAEEVEKAINAKLDSLAARLDQQQR